MSLQIPSHRRNSILLTLVFFFFLIIYITNICCFLICLSPNFRCTADCGWITGHSYVTYGPLLNGVSVVVYEGVLEMRTSIVVSVVMVME